MAATEVRSQKSGKPFHQAQPTIGVEVAKDIIILGARGNHFDILDTIQEINASSKETRYRCIGFLDDNDERWGKDFFGLRCHGPLDKVEDFKNAFFAGPVGSSSNFWKRESVIKDTGVPRERFPNLIHPTASVSEFSQLGQGVIIFQNATITSNIEIGDHVMVFPSAIVSHDDRIGDYTALTGGACVSGHVKIGKSCYIGTNSAIKEGVTIGDRCLVGMGSVVLDDVAENSVVVGNPARFLRHVVTQ